MVRLLVLATSAKPPPNRNIAGGTKVYSVFSGGADGTAVLVWSGAGILNTIQLLDCRQSGLATAMLDCAAGAVVSGLVGFAANSGMLSLGIAPGAQANVHFSGNLPPNTVQLFTPIQVGHPFFSGLAFSTSSGINPFSISYSPLPIPV